MELTIFQYVLIGLLVIVTVLGLMNQKRMKAKKAKEEQEYANISSNANEEEIKTQDEGSEGFVENTPIKEYIQKYGSSYSREGILNALKNSGYNEEEIKTHLDKFYQN